VLFCIQCIYYYIMTILSLSLDFFLKVPGRPGSFWSSLGLLRAESGTHFCRQDFFTTSDSPMELARCFSVMVMADLAILAQMTMSTFNLMSFHLVTLAFHHWRGSAPRTAHGAMCAWRGDLLRTGTVNGGSGSDG